MQTISDKEIKNLPVEGKHGNRIGRVVGIEIELESQVVLNYLVKPKQVVKGIFEGNLIINREQVIELSKDKMIVDDTGPLQSRGEPEAAALPN